MDTEVRIGAIMPVRMHEFLPIYERLKATHGLEPTNNLFLVDAGDGMLLNFLQKEDRLNSTIISAGS